MGSHRLPAAPLSSKNFRGPEVLRPRLTAGLPLSAFGPKAAVHSIESNRRRSVVLRCTSSRSQRRPMRRAPSIDTHRTRTRGNLSHIADITRGLGVGPAMNSSPISEVQPKSRRRLFDLCHMRGLRQLRARQPFEFTCQPSTRLEQFGTVQHSRHSQCARRMALQADRDARTRPTASGRSTIAAPSLRTMPALNGHKKKEAGSPAPLAMTNVVYIVFFLAAAIHKAALSHKAVGKRAFARNLRRRWCFGSPAFVPRFSGRSVALRPCLAAGVPLRSADSQAVGTFTPGRNRIGAD